MVWQAMALGYTYNNVTRNMEVDRTTLIGMGVLGIKYFQDRYIHVLDRYCYNVHFFCSNRLHMALSNHNVALSDFTIEQSLICTC